MCIRDSNTAIINQTHTSLDPYRPLRSSSDSNTHSSLVSTIFKNNNNNNTPSVSGTSDSLFLLFGLLPSRGHPSRRHPSQEHPSQGIRLGGRRSSRLRRPRQMTQTDIPEMERHKDGGLIRLNFPSQGHPSVPFVSAIRLGDIALLQFCSSKYNLAFLTRQNCLEGKMEKTKKIPL